MSKTIKIFIITFIIALGLLLTFYWFTRNKKVDTTTGNTPWYQEFNPFGGGSIISDIINNENTSPNNSENTNSGNENTSKFYKITDFAVAGATFLEDTRPIKDNQVVSQAPEEKTIKIDQATIDGRKEIQKMLNEKLSLSPKLKEDGVFGKMTTDAIKKLQNINGIEQTGKIDVNTEVFFTKKITVNNLPTQSMYETIPSIRYVERATGHIYKMFLDEKKPETISNSTIPGVHEAFFDNNGKTVIYRYLDSDKTINTFLATLGEANGEFLAQNVSDVSISKDGTKYFYLVDTSDGSTGMIRLFGGSGGAVSLNSPFTEWLSQWAGSQKIFLTTKAAFGVSGSIFSLDPAKKALTKVFGGVEGLTTLVNDVGINILYGESSINGPKLYVFDPTTNTTKSLEMYGLPEKCVWSSDNINVYCAVPNTIEGNQYPDVWYQGLVSFNDYFVKINTKTGSKTTIANSQEETSVDATNLFLDDNENNLFFINKKDYTLWLLNLN